METLPTMKTDTLDKIDDDRLDGETGIRRVNQMLSIKGLSDEQKIAILQKVPLVAAREEKKQ